MRLWEQSLLRKLIFENNLEGFCKLLTHVKAVKAQHGLSESVFGMEPTGNYHKPLCSYLVNENHQVVLVSVQAVKNRARGEESVHRQGLPPAKIALFRALFRGRDDVQDPWHDMRLISGLRLADLHNQAYQPA